MYIIDKKYHVIPEDDLWPDPKDDSIGKLLSEKRSFRAIREDLLPLFEIEGYYIFTSSASKYLLSQVGESAIYAVPKDKNGHLKQFRGKITRIVCIGSWGSWSRKYAVGIYKTKANVS
jgi:hypothetical protein